MSAKKSRSLFALVCCLLLSLSMCLPALAADTNVDYEGKGSITVNLLDADGNHKPVRGGSFTLFKVADAVPQDYNLAFKYTEEFAGNGMSLDDVNAEGLAEHLAAYAKENKLEGDTKTAGKDGAVTWDDLDLGLYLVVQEGRASSYYPIAPFLVSVPMTNAEGTGWIYDITANPKAEERPNPPSSDTYLSVKKVWNDDGVSTPDSVTVTLLRDGEVYDTVVLSQKNDWKHTWNGLDRDYKWSIAEIDVPEGYTVSYTTSGKTITITNTKAIPENPETLTVRKVWVDNGHAHPDSVTLELWKGGERYDSVTLNEANGWSHTWTGLPAGKDWDIKEIDVPAGYTVSYDYSGKTVIVTNTYRETVEQTVKKVWAEGSKNHPGAVKVELRNGDVVVDTVVLNNGNNWSHTWTGLDANGKWSVREIEVPKGYTPSYETKGGVTVITNTPGLIQTGQLNWPVPVLAGSGLLLFMLGWVLRRKDSHAE